MEYTIYIDKLILLSADKINFVNIITLVVERQL